MFRPATYPFMPRGFLTPGIWRGHSSILPSTVRTGSSAVQAGTA